MENTPPWRLPLRCSSSSSSAASVVPLLMFFFLSSYEAALIDAPAKSYAFTPPDNFLLDCGNPATTKLPGNRVFIGDQEGAKFLNYKGQDIKSMLPPEDQTVPSQIYRSARVFDSEAIYIFRVTRPGWHWIRLHFAPMPCQEAELNAAKFKVQTSNGMMLTYGYKSELNPEARWSMKEFIVNVLTEHFSISFQPDDGSMAFVNAIEFVSAPDILTDIAKSVFPRGDFPGLSSVAYKTIYRLNAGGPVITPLNDTIGRSWEPDEPYLDPKVTGVAVAVETKVITYPAGESPLIAPPVVYATATQMANANMPVPNFNVTWKMKINPSFQYLIRLHFADIVSKAPNELYFNVYINGQTVISGLDLTTVTGGLTAAYYADFVVNSTMVTSLDPLTIQVGPTLDNTGNKNALLNGLEVFRMNNSIGSLDGLFGADGSGFGLGHRGAVAAVGFTMMVGAFIGLGAMAVKWKKRPQNWQKENSFSSWLLPIHAGDTVFMSGSRSSSGSRKSQVLSSKMGLGRYFTFHEMQEATNNWHTDNIIGVGGFGNVYLGTLSDGLKVGIKRGNPQSEQGINEFQTEIQILSKLRHRHLVSLIGYCDENSEMILVYEYMANGPFRDHLYGKDLSTLTWKQRLEICIGAARGLHYLHTGSAQGIIHRDVKTTNILLDENFVAKMADFGLSKDAPGTDQTHVSTAVKGSFGYLDPEYFWKQQLTDKSDVYSFGVVLLEALCARPAINPALPREQVNLAEWGMQWKRKGELEKIIDPSLVGHINPESMKKFAEAAEKCLAEYGVDRPTMGDVLWNMEYALQLQENSEQGRSEEENKPLPSPAAAAAAVKPAVKSPGSSSSSESGSPKVVTEVPEDSDHSKTAMFTQFEAINGR